MGKLNKLGQLVQWEWEELLRYIELGAYVVMPNHFHGILILHEPVVGRPARDLTWHLRAMFLDLIGSLMALTGRPYHLWKIPALKGTPIWQRNYYEHVIRNEKDLQNKTDYINANPLLWGDDDENPLDIQP